MYVYKLHQCITFCIKNDYECMNQTWLDCGQFLSWFSTHHACVPQPKCACICIYALVCVWAGWGVQGKRKWFFEWCALRDIVKSTLPGGQEHLIVQQAMIALREGSRKREREGNKETESGKEINWLCQWLSLLMGENIEKITFSFSCATSTSALGVMECVCVCLYDWPCYSGHYKNRFYNFKSGKQQGLPVYIYRGQKTAFLAQY